MITTFDGAPSLQDPSLRDTPSLEAVLCRRAQAYLVMAHALDVTRANALAAEAARRVLAGAASPGDGVKARTEPGALVIQIASDLARSEPDSLDRAPLLPPEARRPMRVQLLDPMTLGELGNRSRRGGTKLAESLPRRESVALGATVLMTALLALPSPPL